jgi:hypothetical protein
MLYRLATLASCVALSSAIPFAPQPLQVRQTEPKYADNGTLTNPPNVTSLSRPNPKYTTSQLNQVKLAYTEIERLGLIRSFGNTDDYFKFDLTPDGSQSNAANGLGGQGYLAEVSNFPVLMGTGLSVAIGYLNPCGLDSMHIHNRATEIVTLVKGQSLKTGFVLEDGFGTSPSLSITHPSLICLQTCQYTQKSACTRVPSAPRDQSTGNSMTTASQLSSWHLCPMKTPVCRVRHRISSSIPSRLLMRTWHTHLG